MEKVKLGIHSPLSDSPPGPSQGAIGELLTLFDELGADPGARQKLLADMVDIEKKLPRELKDGSGAIRFDDADWIAELLGQVQPMLIQRLLRKGVSE